MHGSYSPISCPGNTRQQCTLISIKYREQHRPTVIWMITYASTLWYLIRRLQNTQYRRFLTQGADNCVNASLKFTRVQMLA